MSDRLERLSRASSGWYLFASGAVVTDNLMVISPTRAPAFRDGIHAVAKRGQMTGGRGEIARSQKLLSEERRAAAASKPTHRIGGGGARVQLGAFARRVLRRRLPTFPRAPRSSRNGSPASFKSPCMRQFEPSDGRTVDPSPYHRRG